MSRNPLILTFLALGAATTFATAGCGAAEFAVGDCVKVDTRLLDHELESADCPTDSGSQTLGDPTYQVDAALEGKDQSCSVGGPGAVEFSDEPDDMTYCLSFAQ